MTIEKASEIVRIYGNYLEHVGGTNLILFSGKAPESMLPFPKKIILDAMEILAEQHKRNGNQEAAEYLQVFP